MDTLVKRQAAARSAKDLVDQVLCTRSNFAGEVTEGKGGGRKGSAAGKAPALLYGGVAFWKNASAPDGQSSSSSVAGAKAEDTEAGLWFYNAPVSKMCQHLLR